MIKYNGPTENEIIDPSDDFIRDILFKKDEEYWQEGSGDSSIEVDGCNEWLIFFYDRPYGFFIMRFPDYQVPIDKSKPVKEVIHIVGGEPMKVPTCSYLSREDAYRLINGFITNKEIPQSFEWTGLYEINFDNQFR